MYCRKHLVILLSSTTQMSAQNCVTYELCQNYNCRLTSSMALGLIYQVTERVREPAVQTTRPKHRRERESIQTSTPEMAVKCDSYTTSSKTESIVVTNATLCLEYSDLEFLAVSQPSRAFRSVLNVFSLQRACLYLVQQRSRRRSDSQDAAKTGRFVSN